MQRLSRSFVLASEAIEELDAGADDVRRWFREVARQAPGRRMLTDQGIYLFTASGILLASGNHERPAAVRRLLQDALREYEDLAPGDRLDVRMPLSEWQPTAIEKLFPDRGLVLHQTTRVLVPADARRRERFLDPERNYDYVWVAEREVRDWMPREPVVGQELVLDLLADRLARHHFVGTARALASSYDPEHVETAMLRGEVIARTGERITLRLSGRVRTEHRGMPARVRGRAPVPRAAVRGVDLALAGEAHFDLAQGAFEAFELVAFGRHVGGRRGSDLDDHPLAVVLRLADRKLPLHRTPPLLVEDYARQLRATGVSASRRQPVRSRQGRR